MKNADVAVIGGSAAGFVAALTGKTQRRLLSVVASSVWKFSMNSINKARALP